MCSCFCGAIARSPADPEESLSHFASLVLRVQPMLRAWWSRTALLTHSQGNASAHITCFFFFFSGFNPWVGAHSDSLLSPGLMLSGNAMWHTQKHASITSSTLNLINLAMKIKHPSMKGWELQGLVQCRDLSSAFILKEWELEVAPGCDLFLTVTGAGWNPLCWRQGLWKFPNMFSLGFPGSTAWGKAFSQLTFWGGQPKGSRADHASVEESWGGPSFPMSTQDTQEYLCKVSPSDDCGLQKWELKTICLPGRGGSNKCGSHGQKEEGNLWGGLGWARSP